ncbi:restriction endonuclease subunit S [Prevotella sp. P4-51]|uniref:restriction endonuclease subunit S n=1 Tax=Prevotella sp. P4-51 TaxID=2024228 RepID=UPI0020B11EAE|nr:restriction endonuclease subunit S [Prevotella sp. P4-51]
MITNIIFRRSDSPITSDKPHYENEPFNIPRSWIMAQMSDLFLLNPKSEINDNTEIGFIPMACVDDGFSGKHSFEIRNWGDVKKGYCHFQDGDIGVAKISPCFENLKSCILQSLPNGVGTGTTELVILRSLGVYAPFYLYLFKSSWYISQGTKYFKGVVGQQRVNKAIFTELEVPLPSVAEQERIVAEIKRWFGLIDLIEKDKFNLANNIKLAKSKILDLAIHGKLVPQDPTDEPASELLKRINPKAEITCDNGHYQKLPEGWAILKVGDVAEYINGRAFKPEEWEQTGLPIIRIQNLNDPNAYYNRTKNEYEEKYLIKKGDLLFAWAASLGTYIWKGEDAWLNQHIFKVVPYPFMDKKYLYYAFHAMITEFYRKSHGSGMIHITRKQFEEITLWLPPLAEQYRIVQYLQQVFEKLDSIVENL